MEILIAHPDPDVCAAIVRELGDRYRLVVVNSAEDALSHLELAVDLRAVVVGHRLDTGPDGVALLDIVAHRLPGVPRVLISKENRSTGARRACRTQVAHRIVAAPWRFGAVASAIDSLRLRMHMRRFHRLGTNDRQVDTSPRRRTTGPLGIVGFRKSS